jgi:hypothetical protein
VRQPEIGFTPSPDVVVLLNALLNKLERRSPVPLMTNGETRAVRTVKIVIREAGLPGYDSQMDPEPRQVANDQLLTLEKFGLLRLFWHAGETGHLLDAAALVLGKEATLYALIGRIPTTSLRTRLEGLLLGDRFRFGEYDWRYRSIQHTLSQLKEGRSPAPFSLADPVFNEDLLTALVALSGLNEETPFRVFSVHTFNDSKRFEDLRKAVIRMARIGQPDWKRLPEDELLRELNLVANPTYLLLAGPWTLVDQNGQVLSLGEFSPSVGVPAVQAAHLERVNIHAGAVICVENLTTFHAMASSLISVPQNTALLCLAGNPSPACRRLLKRLEHSLPPEVPLYTWADLDYGGFNILAQLRKHVSPRFTPYRMDIDTLDRCVQFARPLTQHDRRNLERHLKRPELRDVQPVIQSLLQRGLKLEQEAIPI